MAVWQAFFCLTLLSFLCRAAIPVGYMPDPSGSRAGSFAITLCSGGGPALVQFDLLAEAGESSPDDAYAGKACPFGLIASQELLPGSTALAVAGFLSFLPAASPVDSGSRPRESLLGPPVGSRAPPAHIV